MCAIWRSVLLETPAMHLFGCGRARADDRLISLPFGSAWLPQDEHRPEGRATAERVVCPLPRPSPRAVIRTVGTSGGLWSPGGAGWP